MRYHFDNVVAVVEAKSVTIFIAAVSMNHSHSTFGVMMDMMTPIAECVSRVGDTLVAVGAGSIVAAYVCTSPLIAAETLRKHRPTSSAYGIRQRSCHLALAVRRRC